MVKLDRTIACWFITPGTDTLRRRGFNFDLDEDRREYIRFMSWAVNSGVVVLSMSRRGPNEAQVNRLIELSGDVHFDRLDA